MLVRRLAADQQPWPTAMAVDTTVPPAQVEQNVLRSLGAAQTAAARPTGRVLPGVPAPARPGAKEGVP